MKMLRLYASAALLTALSAATTYGQPCPVATSSQSGWVRHESREFGIEMLAPLSFDRMNWSSRSDSTSLLFSLWKDAATTVDFAGPTHRIAKYVGSAKGTACVLKTAAGSLRLKVWRWIGGQYDGRDTTYFDAGGEITLPGRPRMFVKLTAHDSLTLLVNLQMLQTLKVLKNYP
ncbi:MAG: hypothetical protein ABJC26_05220 [Gemmatimonadaceae bacterium]